MRTVVDAQVAIAAITVAVTLIHAPIAVATPARPDDGTSCSATELDPCYRKDQMSLFAAAGQRMVTDYLTQFGVTTDSVPALTFIPSDGNVGSECVDVNGNDKQHDRSFDYCPTDNTVYIGQNALWDSYRQYRAAGPLSGLAHEYGHFLQSVMQVPSPNSATETIRNENQADCFSGAFIGYRDRGEAPGSDDVESVEQYLTATASVDGPGRDHGTAEERVASFTLGYTGGLAACNRFYPATPLVR